MHRVSASSGGCEVSHLAAVSLGQLGLGVALLEYAQGELGVKEKSLLSLVPREGFSFHKLNLSFLVVESHCTAGRVTAWRRGRVRILWRQYS